MTKYRNHFLKRIQDVHAFITEHPGCSFADIEKRMQLKPAAVRYAVNSLKDSGHIDPVDGKRYQGGSSPKIYFILKAERPEVLPETSTARAKRIAEDDASVFIKRKFCKASQIGMKPDPLALPVEFFGARAVA